MNKREMIFGITGVVAGGMLGFLTGYKLLEKKVQREHDEKLQRQVSQLHNIEDSTDAKDTNDISDVSETEMKDFNTMVNDLKYGLDKNEVENEHEDESMNSVSDDDVEITIIKKHRKPKVLGKTQMDIDDPDLKYDSEELFYFMEDKVLTDTNGLLVDESDLIGNNLRRYGFMQGEGDLDTVWVRNYDYEVDYEIHRDAGSSSEMFGEE